MSPAWIRRREHPPTARHPRGHATFQVLYRRGGRETRIETLGTFDKDREARLRRDLAAGWLAQGLDPKTMLASLGAETSPVTFKAAQQAMIAARVDVDENTRLGYHRRGRLLDDLIGDRPVASFTDTDGQALVAALTAHKTRAGTMKPSSVKAYFGQARQVLDHARIRPNPFRDDLVRLPRDAKVEPSPPSAREVLTIGRLVPVRHVKPLALLETTGMRVGELAFPWGDVDTVDSRIRLTRAATKTNRPRWVQVPAWLMVWIEDECPVEDRTASRRVFPLASDAALRQAMGRACRQAGLALYSPHDLRHRRISLWHGQGIPWKEIADRVGHVKPSDTLDTYSHVMPLDEIDEQAWAEVLTR